MFLAVSAPNENSVSISLPKFTICCSSTPNYTILSQLGINVHVYFPLGFVPRCAKMERERTKIMRRAKTRICQEKNQALYY